MLLSLSSCLGLLDKLKRSKKLKQVEFPAVGYGVTEYSLHDGATSGGERKVCVCFHDYTYMY
jgi:hypothetical protein